MTQTTELQLFTHYGTKAIFRLPSTSASDTVHRFTFPAKYVKNLFKCDNIYAHLGASQTGAMILDGAGIAYRMFYTSVAATGTQNYNDRGMHISGDGTIQITLGGATTITQLNVTVEVL